MEKERTVIFTISSLYVRKVKGEDIDLWPSWSRTQLVGWYSDLETAKRCVEEDWADFDEAGYYNYIVIERHVEGLYNLSGFDFDGEKEWWYSYDHKEEKWISCQKPKWAQRLCGWGLG